MANNVEKNDLLLELLFCLDSDPGGPESLDQQLADPLEKFFEQLALGRALAKGSSGSEPG